MKTQPDICVVLTSCGVKVLTRDPAMTQKLVIILDWRRDGRVGFHRLNIQGGLDVAVAESRMAGEPRAEGTIFADSLSENNFWKSREPEAELPEAIGKFLAKK